MMVAPSGAAPRQSKCVGPSTCRARAAQRAPLRSARPPTTRSALFFAVRPALSVNGCFLSSRSPILQRQIIFDPILQRRAASHQPSHMRVVFASGHGAGGGGPEGAPRRRGWRSGQRCRTSIPRRARRARAPATPGARPPPRRPPPRELARAPRGPPRAARARRPRGNARTPRRPRPPEPARARRGGAVRVSRARRREGARVRRGMCGPEAGSRAGARASPRKEIRPRSAAAAAASSTAARTCARAPAAQPRRAFDRYLTGI